MKHTAMTDEQIAEAGLMPEGVRDFTIASAVEKQSAKGNDMFELQLTVYDDAGNPRPIRDWVMPSFAKKFKHLHDALGILDVYKKGETKPEDLIGKSGKVMLKIGEPRVNRDGFDVRYNEVADYVKREAGAEPAKKEKPKMDKSVEKDEIPF